VGKDTERKTVSNYEKDCETPAQEKTIPCLKRRKIVILNTILLMECGFIVRIAERLSSLPKLQCLKF